MSLRYVWDVFQRDKYDFYFSASSGYNLDFQQLVNGNPPVYYQYEFDQNTGKFSYPSSSKVSYNSLDYSKNIYSSSGNDCIKYKLGIGSLPMLPYATSIGISKVIKTSSKVYVKSVSHFDKNQYPNNDIHENYLYVLKGSDSIDPQNITFPLIDNNKILSNKQSSSKNIQISITESNKIQYGGIIYYSVDYQINSNTQWQNACSSNPSNLIQIRLPMEAKSIKVRVKASDSTGFISQNYIESPTMQIIDMKRKCSHSYCNRQLVLAFIFTFILIPGYKS